MEDFTVIEVLMAVFIAVQNIFLAAKRLFGKK